jgi:hypothetical protein
MSDDVMGTTRTPNRIEDMEIAATYDTHTQPSLTDLLSTNVMILSYHAQAWLARQSWAGSVSRERRGRLHEEKRDSKHKIIMWETRSETGD